MPRRGPRRPSWTFRPSPGAQDAVVSYMKEHGTPDRTQALNSMLEAPSRVAHHLTDDPRDNRPETRGIAPESAGRRRRGRRREL